MSRYGRDEHPQLHPRGGGRGRNARGGAYNFYRWRRRRRLHLMSHPLCAMCEAEGRVMPAEIVHHVEPHDGNVAAFWFGELQSLCRDHHEKLHGRNLKVQIGEDGWPVQQQEAMLWPTASTANASITSATELKLQSRMTKAKTPKTSS